MAEIFRDKLVLAEGSEVQKLDLVSKLSDAHIDQLTTYAIEDPLVLVNTSDSRRFGSKDAYYSWLAKNRRIMALVKDEELLGLIWFGKEPMPERNYLESFSPEDHPVTTAQRMFGRARGRGLAKLHIAASFETGLEEGYFEETGKNGIWFDTAYDNFAIHKSWSTFGFEKVANRNERGRIIMAASLTVVKRGLQAYRNFLASRAA